MHRTRLPRVWDAPNMVLKWRLRLYRLGPTGGLEANERRGDHEVGMSLRKEGRIPIIKTRMSDLACLDRVRVRSRRLIRPLDHAGLMPTASTPLRQCLDANGWDVPGTNGTAPPGLTLPGLPRVSRAPGGQRLGARLDRPRVLLVT